MTRLLKITLETLFLAEALLLPISAKAQEIQGPYLNPQRIACLERIPVEKSADATLEELSSDFIKTLDKRTREKYNLLEQKNTKYQLEEYDTIKRMQDPYNPIPPTDEEKKRAAFLIGNIIIDGLKSTTDKIPEIKNAKQSISKATQFELYTKSDKSENEALSPTEQEEQRKEKERQENTTRIKIFQDKEFSFGTTTGTKTYLDKDFKPVIEAYAGISNLDLQFAEMKKLCLTLDSKGRTGVLIENKINDNWSTGLRFSTSENFGSSIEEASFSVTRETPQKYSTDPRQRTFRTKTTIGVGKAKDEGEFIRLDTGILW